MNKLTIIDSKLIFIPSTCAIITINFVSIGDISNIIANYLGTIWNINQLIAKKVGLLGILATLSPIMLRLIGTSAT